MRGHKVKVTTDTNSHNSCITTHILPYNFIICYGNYLKLTDVIGIGMQDANNASNFLQISARVTDPVYHFIIVLYGKTEPWLCQTVD